MIPLQYYAPGHISFATTARPLRIPQNAGDCRGIVPQKMPEEFKLKFFL